MFNNSRYLTAGVAATIPEYLQLFIWRRHTQLASDEAIRELSQIHTYLEDLREKYSFHQAVAFYDGA